jgi:hypothetical protein
MVWDIIIIIIGIFVLFLISAYFGSCIYHYRNTRGFEKKAWKRALEGWGILLFWTLIDLVARIVKLLTN